MLSPGSIAGSAPPLDWASFRGARPRTVRDVLAEAADVPPFLLDGLVHPTATLLTGHPKAGKTFSLVSGSGPWPPVSPGTTDR